MLFDLRDVMRHVVHHVHVQVVRGGVEHLRERLPAQKRHAAPVHPRVVRRARHGAEIVLALRRVNSRARQLSIVRLDPVPRHRALHLRQRVRRDLMTEPSAAAVDHHHDLPDGVHAHLLGGVRIEDLIHDLNLRVVIPRAERPHLREPALLRARADFVRVRGEHPPVLLAVLFVLRPRVPLSQRPVHPHLQRRLQPGGGRGDDPLRPDAHRDVIEKRLRELLLDVRDVALHEVRPHDAHAAIDVEPDASWRDHRGGIAHVERGDVSDAEPVPAVDVRHRDRLAHDPGQARDVRELLHRGEEPAVAAAVDVLLQLLEHERLEVFVHVERPRHAHVGNEPLVHDPLVRGDSRQERHLLLVRSSRRHRGRGGREGRGVRARGGGGGGGGARCVWR
eukprot:31027-Pelagococcus_subviridis.AAC.5